MAPCQIPMHAKLSTQSLLTAMLCSLIARRRFGPQTKLRPLCEALTSGLGIHNMSGLTRHGSTIVLY